MDSKVKQYSIGSLFAGIGGFELGLERAIPGAYTLWQVEQNLFCQKVLAEHWPQAKIYDDVRNITKNNVEQVDILCGGFPCQDISVAGKGEGLHGKRSGLWWEMHRIIDELQPKAVIMENVAAITIRGLGTVLGSLSQIGYDAEWCTIRASDFGAPHHRARWFCISYPTYSNQERCKEYSIEQEQAIRGASEMPEYSNRRVSQEESNHWRLFPIEPRVCRRDHGIPNRVDRLAALGNAIVPQCSEWIGRKLWESGILQNSD